MWKLSRYRSWFIATARQTSELNGAGVVSAVSAGPVVITVLHEGVSGFVRVSVDLGGTDRDGDGIPDDVELANGFDPDDPLDGFADEDGDGFSVADGDCNDDNDRVFPGANERCNGIDDDCDGLVPPDASDLGTEAFCTAACPCSVYEGDCDFDVECEGNWNNRINF